MASFCSVSLCSVFLDTPVLTPPFFCYRVFSSLKNEGCPEEESVIMSNSYRTSIRLVQSVHLVWCILMWLVSFTAIPFSIFTQIYPDLKIWCMALLVVMLSCFIFQGILNVACKGCPLTRLENSLRLRADRNFVPVKSFISLFCAKNFGWDVPPEMIRLIILVMAAAAIIVLPFVIGSLLFP